MTSVPELAAQHLARALYDLERFSEGGAEHFASWTLQEFVDEIVNPTADVFLWSDQSGVLDSKSFLNGASDPAGIAGFVLSRHFDDEAEIMDLAVRHKGRGQGVRLIEAFLTEIKKRGGKRVFLEVAESNAPAIAAYKKCGFKRQQIRPAYYRDGQDAWVMLWEDPQ